MREFRILRINLRTQSFKIDIVEMDLVRKFLGGLGLAAYYLYKEVGRGVDALGEENKIIFSPGLLVGTGLPTMSKSTLVFKSPLTGGFGRAVVGARMGVSLKKAGYDMMIVEGKSKEPCTIVVKDEEVRIEGAEDLWGMDAIATQKKLKERYGKGVSTAAIGPAGENLSLVSSVDFEERQAARCGVGAVFGSKKLKAIVVDGSKKIEFHNEEKLKSLRDELLRRIIEDKETTKYRDLGTGASYELLNKLGIFPSKNFLYSYFRKAYDSKGYSNLDPKIFVPTRRVGRNPCPGCPIACSRVVELKKWMNGQRVDGPEYETLYSLGSNLEIDDVDDVAYLNYLCDIYGLDTISAGVTIGWAMEAYERGLLSKEDCDGIELRFGSVEAAAEALRKMAYREGKLGELLADGVKRASEKLGKESWKFAMHVKGLELPAYDVRNAKGIALAFAVSYRGACHLTSSNYSTEISGASWAFSTVDRLSYEEKGFYVKFHEDLMQVYDSLGICKFARSIYRFEEIRRCIEFSYGFMCSNADIMNTGERIYNLIRMFNVREGFSRTEDSLPSRVLEHGSMRKEIELMLDQYYQARGWDENGVPHRAKLASLDIEDLIS